MRTIRVVFTVCVFAVLTIGALVANPTGSGGGDGEAERAAISPVAAE